MAAARRSFSGTSHGAEYAHRSGNAGDESVTTVESIITQSKQIRNRITELGRGLKVAPDLVTAAALHVELESLKPKLLKLAKSMITDVKIRAGGEEHRLRDAQAALFGLAEDAARAVSSVAAGEEHLSRHGSLDASDSMAVLDDQLALLRRHVFDESANERKGLFL